METTRLQKPTAEVHSVETCSRRILPVKDALEILSGKWKLPIIISLTFGTKRFRQIAKEVEGITDKMLSKELRDLEMNQLVKRTVKDAFPPIVEYTITEHGNSLKTVIESLHDWGLKHRQKVMS